MNPLAYKPNAAAVTDRLTRLYNRRAPDQVFASFSVPSPTLQEFRAHSTGGFCNYPDPLARIDFWDRLLRERAELDDDSMPSAYLTEFDQGLYGGLLGGDVRFLCDPATGWISSMVPPLLRDPADFDLLRFDPHHPWLQRFRRQLAIFVERADDNFGVSHLILIDGLNFVFELVGATKTYLSLIDRPDMVRRAIDFAFDLNLRLHTLFFDAVGAPERGTFSTMVEWVPGRIVSESVDPFHMTAVACFEEWGREPAQRIFDAFDGGVLHLHGNGRHLLETVCSLRGLKAICMGDDKGFPPAIDVARDLRRRAADVPLIIPADYPTFIEKLRRRELPGGVFYHVSGAPDPAAANRAMEAIRRYRAG